MQGRPPHATSAGVRLPEKQAALGLTAALAPGVAGGEWDPGLYEFRNYPVAEVQRDLAGFIERLRGVNPASRIMAGPPLAWRSRAIRGGG